MKDMKKIISVITAVILCTIIIAVLFNTQLQNDSASLYVESYSFGFNSNKTSYGNIVLVNPTADSLSNLNMTIQVDNSELILPNLRLWHSNYTVNTPNSFLESYDMSTAVENFSTSITTINIEPNQNLTINIGFPATDTFQFSPHNLTIYVSQNSFADTINGQTLTMPQTEAYIQILSYSQIQSDYDSYHRFWDSTRQQYVYRNDNPNFLQRYFNIIKTDDIGSSVWRLMAYIDVLNINYFNVTVFNNNTFPVNSVRLFGQISDDGGRLGGALFDYVLQPGETYVFPVRGLELPTNAYSTGYITNSTLKKS